MNFLNKLFCLHYYERIPSIKYSAKFFSGIDATGWGNKKKMICNKCGKITYKPMDFIDIKYLKKSQ